MPFKNFEGLIFLKFHGPVFLFFFISDDCNPYNGIGMCAGVAHLIRQSLSFGSAHQRYQDGWKEGWTGLEDICRIATDCTCLWKHGTKNPKKRRALADLFEILERCGLSKHMSIFFEVSI